MYNGEITGLEESFEFDAQYTFKVCSYIQICITLHYSFNRAHNAYKVQHISP